ncbi:Uncharacterised protein [uncultured Eubacterium sp.]|nr:Uncharacterised protein [uncultured Eubacterium sp.]
MMRKKLAVTFFMLCIVFCIFGCREKIEEIWYLVQEDNFGATLELNDGVAIYHNSDVYKQTEFQYSIKGDEIVLKAEDIVITFAIVDDENDGKVLMLDKEIYACASNKTAEKIIKEKKEIIRKEQREREKKKNIALMEEKTKRVKAEILGAWRADEMTPSLYGTFIFYQDGTYSWGHRDQYPSGNPPLVGNYTVEYESSYHGESNTKNVKIFINLYNEDEDTCWTKFKYDENDDILICIDEECRGPYYRQ